MTRSSTRVRSAAKRKRVSESDEEFHFVDLHSEQPNCEYSDQDSSDEEDDHHIDNAKAKSRLDQFVKEGAISLMGGSGHDRTYRKQDTKDSLTIEVANENLNISDNDSVFKCAICHEHFDSLTSKSRHELVEHFVWVFKPLLMHLLDIIEDESYHCSCSGCPLRLQLLKCIKSHQTCCPECHFTSDFSDSLMEHFKGQHVSKVLPKVDVANHLTVNKEDSPDQSPYHPESDAGDVADDYNDDDNDDWWEPPKQDKDTSKSSLDNDQKSSNDDQQNRFTCEECDAKFSTRNHLNRHIIAKHSSRVESGKDTSISGISEKKFACVDCDAKYWKQSQLNRHIRDKHPKVPKAQEHVWECVECGIIYNRQHDLNRHRLAKHSKNSASENEHDTSLLCGECGAVFLSKKGLDAHVQNKHSNRSTGPEKNQSLLCVECGVEYKGKPSMDRHLLTEHSRKLKCEMCDFATGSKDKLSRHLLHWHTKMCKDCGLPIDAVELNGNTKGNYRIKLYTHNIGHECPVRLGPGKLEASESVGKWKRAMNGMVSIPSGYGCTKCGFTSRRSTAIMRHLSLMHENQTCPIQGCDLIFDTRPMLLGHLKQVHPEKCYMCLYEDGVDLGEHDCVRRLMFPAPEDVGAKHSYNPMIMHVTCRARPVGCNVCGELLSSNTRLIHHNYSNHPVKPDDDS